MRAGDRSPPLGNTVLPSQKCALMEQVAHQTIVMQFILELAKSLKVDPRACFRQFFTKIKVGRWSSSGISLRSTGGGRCGSTRTQAPVIRISSISRGLVRRGAG